jgi:hypothetical protein
MDVKADAKIRLDGDLGEIYICTEWIVRFWTQAGAKGGAAISDRR